MGEEKRPSIASVFELYPGAEGITGLSSEDAAAANLQMAEKFGSAAGSLFLGDQPALRVIDVMAVTPGPGLGIPPRGDIPVWPADTREALERHLTSPMEGRGLRMALLHWTGDAGTLQGLRKAMMMDVDVIVLGILDGAPAPDHLLYDALHTAAETGSDVVVLVSSGEPPSRLLHSAFVEHVQRSMRKG